MRHNLFCLLVISLVSITLSVAVLAFIAHGNPAYLRDYRTNGYDGRHYVRLGQNFLLRGVYSREEHAPYRPDINRPPLYPLVAGGISVLFKAIWPLYVLQMMLSLGTSILLYLLISSLFGRFAGLLVGLLHASEPTLAILNSQVLTEPSFVFLTTLGLFLWIRTIFPPEGRSRSYALYLLAGLALGLAALIRPTGLYFPVLLCLIHVSILLHRKAFVHVLRPLLLLLAAYVIIIPWVVRNHSVFGIWRYTTIDSLNLVYYVGAGVYQRELSIPTLEEAQARMASDYHLVPATVAHNFWLADEPIKLLESQWRNAAWEIFSRYPTTTLRTLASGLTIGLISHNVDDLALAGGMRWINPGLTSLLRGDLSGFLSRLSHNHPFLIVLFIWIEVVTVASCVWTLFAVFTSLTTGRWRTFTLICLTLLCYFLANIILQAPTPDARMRTPLFSILLLLLPVVIPGNVAHLLGGRNTAFKGPVLDGCCRSENSTRSGP